MHIFLNLSSCLPYLHSWNTLLVIIFYVPMGILLPVKYTMYAQKAQVGWGELFTHDGNTYF